MAHARDEVEAVVTRYCDVRRRIDAGELPWGALAQFFTDDCVYIDPAWGRVEGIGPVSEFFEDSMRGLSESAKHRFYSENFADLMGGAL